MRVIWYPRKTILAVALLGLLAFALRLAIDFSAGAVAGLLALLCYLGVDVGITFNPHALGRERRH
jgi:hypothetical protein